MLRSEWEMATSDLREESGVTDRPTFTAALDELQAAMLVVPSEVYYQPKFTYIWTLAVGRFPDELRQRVRRDVALREIARCFLARRRHDRPRRAGARNRPVAPGGRPRQPRPGGGRVCDDGWRRGGISSSLIFSKGPDSSRKGPVMFRVLATLVFVCGVTAGASAQSFDCTKAHSRIEQLICADKAVSELDEYLGRYYAAARAGNPAAAACLQADQFGWLQ